MGKHRECFPAWPVCHNPANTFSFSRRWSGRINAYAECREMRSILTGLWGDEHNRLTQISMQHTNCENGTNPKVRTLRFKRLQTLAAAAAAPVWTPES